MSAPSALFDALIDYAGLFPPAKLSMPDAVRQYATHVRGPHSSQLGRFVVPLARLAEFATAYSLLPIAEQAGWTLSGLGTGDPGAEALAIAAHNKLHPSAPIVAVELKAATPADVARVGTGWLRGLKVWVEVPCADDVTPLMAAIKVANCCAKIRTGGVTPDAFPQAAQVARFLAVCHDVGVVCKATAGLHHPLRGDYRLTYEPGSPTGPMFGFLNVFLAATLLHGGGALSEAEGLLLESNAANFRVTPAAIQWRTHSFSSAQIHAARQSLCRSFGSCSFTEPIAGLQELHWL